MEQEILDRLTAATPPKTRKWKFSSIADANAEIFRLENRVSDLEKLLIAKNSETVVPLAAPVVPEKTGRERFTAATKVLGGNIPPAEISAPVKKDGAKLTGRARWAGIKTS